MVVLVESGGGMRKDAWAPGQKFGETRWKRVRGMELLLPGAGCPGTRADVWAPVSRTNAMNSTGKRATPGQNSDAFVDGNCG